MLNKCIGLGGYFTQSAFWGYYNVTKTLLEHGANVSAYNNNAIIWASYNGHTDVIKLLLEHGADVHACNDQAIIWASNNRYTNVVKLLQEYMNNA